jgi:hypothetical protein
MNFGNKFIFNTITGINFHTKNKIKYKYEPIHLAQSRHQQEYIVQVYILLMIP